MSRVRAVRALLEAWLKLEFFGASRRSGHGGSALTTAIFTQAFLALVLAAITLDDRIGTTAFAAANLSLTTLLIGLGGLADPTRRDRRAADDVVLGTSPAPAGTRALAGAALGGLRIALASGGVALPPAFLIASTPSGGLGTSLRYLVAAVLLAALVGAAIAVAVRSVERLRGEVAAGLFAGTLRALLLAAGFVGFARGLPLLDDGRAALGLPDALLWLWPPYPAARFVAEPLANLPALAGLALAGVGLSGLAAWLDRGDTAARSGTARRPGLLSRATAALTGDGPARGVAAFAATMMYRSPGFRARVLPLLGLPLAMAFLSIGAESGADALLLGILMQFPAIYTPILVAFLPVSDQYGTGWMFATSPRLELATVRTATAVALAIHVLLPAIVVGAAAALVAGYPPLAVATLAPFAVGTAALAALRGARRLEVAPFTGDQDAASALDTGDLLVGAFAFTALGGLAATTAAGPLGPVLGSLAAIAGVTVLRLAVQRAARGDLAPADRPAGVSPLAAVAAGGESPVAGATPDATSSPGLATARSARTARPPESLRREFLAVGTLYAALLAMLAVLRAALF